MKDMEKEIKSFNSLYVDNNKITIDNDNISK
jgi:hypothetical protein